MPSYEAPLIFTANGGADLFSIDGIIKQQMSANREFQTTTLKKVKSLALERGMQNFDGK
jgi:hypothetical protein